MGANSTASHYNVRASANLDNKNFQKMAGPSSNVQGLTAKNMAQPATSQGLQEILANPLLKAPVSKSH